MLDRLRPEGADDDDDEDDDNNDNERRREPERPQFVLGPEVDEDKPSTEHREEAESSSVQHPDGTRISTGSDRAKGWKEV
jgi:hypothetical protein